MKKTISILVVILIAVTIVLASDSIFQSFIASSGTNAVTLEWRTSTEGGITKFEVERSSQNLPFAKIGEEIAKGFPTQYRYVDSEAMIKSTELMAEKQNDKVLSKTSYTYRLKAVYSNGSSTLSDEISVNHSINSIRRTWGMIKEMFR